MSPSLLSHFPVHREEGNGVKGGVFFFVVVVFCLVETTIVCIREVFGRGVRVSLQVQCP